MHNYRLTRTRVCVTLRLRNNNNTVLRSQRELRSFEIFSLFSFFPKRVLRFNDDVETRYRGPREHRMAITIKPGPADKPSVNA